MSGLPTHHLGAHLRIREGTFWPEETELLLMPVMASSRDRFKDKTVLDIGTGCGILGLYAARLGAARVVATDIEPRALDCTRENARRLGLGDVIETRLVDPMDPSAFSVIRPGEQFDVVVSFPFGYLNRHPFVVAGTPDDGIDPNDTVRFGLSIVNGLAAHLHPRGAALLCYRFSALHTLMVNYASHLGYRVEHHPALHIPPPDWFTTYNTLAMQVAASEHIRPEALLVPMGVFESQEPGDPFALPDDVAGPGPRPPPPEGPPGPPAGLAPAAAHPPGQDVPPDEPRGSHLRGLGVPGDSDISRIHSPGGPFLPHFSKLDFHAVRGLSFPHLWERELDRVLPGVIVIRKEEAATAKPRSATGTTAERAASQSMATSAPPTAPVDANQGHSQGASGGCFEYDSAFLGHRIRVCKATPWPASTELGLMPLMAAGQDRFRGKTVLDIGTGCGILALHAAQLGATRVVATDVVPEALDCTRENAQRLGLERVVETRLVSMEDPSAFSAIRPEEMFDFVISAPVQVANRIPAATPKGVDPGLTANDFIRLGLSIVRGLEAHLRPEGVALLIYRSEVIHDLVAAYAGRMGFLVERHPAQMLLDADWRTLYNTFAVRVAEREGIDPAALLLARPSVDPDDPAAPSSFFKVDYLGIQGGDFPRLWNGRFSRVVPGLIVIRRPSSGQDPRPTGAQDPR